MKNRPGVYQKEETGRERYSSTKKRKKERKRYTHFPSVSGGALARARLYGKTLIMAPLREMDHISVFTTFSLKAMQSRSNRRPFYP